VLRVIGRDHDDTGNGYGTESGGIKVRVRSGCGARLSMLATTPAIGATESAMGQQNDYYKLSVQG
jgi:hypothetical protein